MEVKPHDHDVMVVSAFGRGDWLAAELKSFGLSVGLVDVTAMLGVWPPEDIEGPFGFFMLDRYPQSFLEALSHQDKFSRVENGFAVWSETGPLEMKSPVTPYRFTKLGLHAKLWKTLSQASSGETLDLADFQGRPFQEIWPLALAYQLASTTYHSNVTGLGRGQALPLLNSFLVRFGTRIGPEKSLEWLASKGVEIFTKSEILDLALAGRKKLTGMELKGWVSGFHRFDHLIWGLSSEETYFLNERIGQKLFPQGIVESTWSWVRYRLRLNACVEIKMTPPCFCLVDDLMAPWAHENLCLIHKTAVDENLDAWIRMPTVQRFNKDYLKIMGERILRLFSARIPLSEPTIQSYPQEYYYTYKELGPPRFPIFESADSVLRRASGFSHFHRDGVEVWENFTKDCQFKYQSKLRDQILRSWQQKQHKSKKIKELERD